jgi:hypothetical protein
MLPLYVVISHRELVMLSYDTSHLHPCNVRVNDRIIIPPTMGNIELHCCYWRHISLPSCIRVPFQYQVPPEIADIELHGCDRSDVSLPSYIRLSRDF